MNIVSYLEYCIKHNFKVVINALFEDAFKAFDYVKCKWFVLTKQGDSLDYYLKWVYSESHFRLMEEDGYQVYYMVTELSKALDLTVLLQEEIAYSFSPSFGVKTFTLNPDFFLWKKRVAEIKTGMDLFMALAIRGWVSRPDALERFTPIQFYTLQTAKITDMRVLLKKIVSLEQAFITSELI